MEPSLNEIVEDFLIHKEIEVNEAESTIRAYRYELNYIYNILEEIIGESFKIQDINHIHIRKLIQYLGKKLGGIVKKKNSPETIARKISCLNSFFKFAVLNDYINYNPMSKIALPKLGEKVVKIPSQNDLNNLFKYLEDDREFRNEFEKESYLIFFHFIYNMMARIGEVVKIKISDINFDEKIVIIKGKGNKERFGLLDDKTTHMIIDYIKKYELTKDDYVLKNKDFPFWKNQLDKLNEDLKTEKEEHKIGKIKKKIDILKKKIGSQISIRALQYRAKSIRKELDFPDWMTSHPFFRKRPASSLDEMGYTLAMIQDLLGHANPKTTRRYVASNIDKAKTEFHKKHPLEALH